MQPAASAGATLQAIWLIGQFHGVMKPQTPIGSRTISVVPRCSSNSKVLEHLERLAMWPRPVAACAAVDSQIGAPISSEIGGADVAHALLVDRDDLVSSARRSSRVVVARRSRTRARAAATALSTSALEPSETS